MPPDALDGIGVRSILGQKMNRDAMSTAREKLIDQTAIVEGRIVADDVNVPIAAQALPQVLQMLDEQAHRADACAEAQSESVGRA